MLDIATVVSVASSRLLWDGAATPCPTSLNSELSYSNIDYQTQLYYYLTHNREGEEMDSYLKHRYLHPSECNELDWIPHCEPLNITPPTHPATH